MVNFLIQSPLCIFEELLQHIPVSVFDMVREVDLAKYAASPAIRYVTEMATPDRDLKIPNAKSSLPLRGDNYETSYIGRFTPRRKNLTLTPQPGLEPATQAANVTEYR